ncbi:MAG TPA: M20 family metallopeptidase [Sedimentisphaerales bacterium]|nr:M20 family metallopeptidase [Sedimentisphaerales bacterium]
MFETLKRLIAAKSTSEVGEMAAAQVVADVLSRNGVDCRLDSWAPNRANVLAHLESKGEKPGILFLAHLDVVGADEKAWHTPPFEAVEAGGRIYGRGAVDMKGGLAAAMEALKRVAMNRKDLKGSVYLAAVAGEETDSAGINRLVSHIDRLGGISGVVICEPTGLKMVTSHRGMLWVKITTLGKSAHGAMPHAGINAIDSMLAALEKVRGIDSGPVSHHRLGKGTISINCISGGIATNIIPDACSAEIDARVVPGQSTASVLNGFQHVIEQLRAASPAFQAKLEVMKRAEALETEDNCEFVRNLCEATGISERSSVGFTTDGPWLKPLGAPVVVFGPGDPELCHKPDEYIEMSELQRAADYYYTIILHCLAETP